MWKAVKTKTRKIRVGKVKRRREKREGRKKNKKKVNKRKKKTRKEKTKKKTNDGDEESSRGIGDLEQRRRSSKIRSRSKEASCHELIP